MHNWLDGLKRIPLHLAVFSAPVGVAVHFLPWPFKAAVAGPFILWRIAAEVSDVVQHRDTPAKALIDLLSQTAGAVVGLHV
jgi:hypothetical protein